MRGATRPSGASRPPGTMSPVREVEEADDSAGNDVSLDLTPGYMSLWRESHHRSAEIFAQRKQVQEQSHDKGLGNATADNLLMWRWVEATNQNLQQVMSSLDKMSHKIDGSWHVLRDVATTQAALVETVALFGQSAGSRATSAPNSARTPTDSAKHNPLQATSASGTSSPMPPTHGVPLLSTAAANAREPAELGDSSAVSRSCATPALHGSAAASEVGEAAGLKEAIREVLAPALQAEIQRVEVSLGAMLDLVLQSTGGGGQHVCEASAADTANGQKAQVAVLGPELISVNSVGGELHSDGGEPHMWTRRSSYGDIIIGKDSSVPEQAAGASLPIRPFGEGLSVRRMSSGRHTSHPTTRTGSTNQPPSNRLREANCDEEAVTFSLMLQAGRVQAKKPGDAVGEHVPSDRSKVPRPTPSKLSSLLASRCFKRLVNLSIVANAVMAGCSAQYAVSNPESPHQQSFVIIEVLLTCCLCFELCLKISAFRLDFFRGPGGPWNLFDLVILFASAAHLIATHLVFRTWQQRRIRGTGVGASLNLAFFRVLRIFQMSQTWRAVRVTRAFRGYRIMLLCLKASLKSLLWGILLLALFFYMFSIFFMGATAEYCANPDAGTREKDELMKYWGSLFESMLSLLRVSTGGCDWDDVAQPLREAGPVYYAVFCFYIAFMVLVLLNILTGVIVESAMKCSKLDSEGQIAEVVHEDQQALLNFEAMFCFMAEESTHVTRNDLERHLESPAIRAYFEVMGIHIWDVDRFYQLLTSFDPAATLDKATFVDGCMRLRSQSKGDIEVVMAATAEMRSLQAQLSELSGAINRLDAGGCHAHGLQCPERSLMIPHLRSRS